MEHNRIVILALILAVYVIRFLFVKVYLPKIKGVKGEYSVRKRLRKLNKKEYRIFNDVYLRINGRSTQIDHLIISVYGIFVIETKNYKGWIHGGENSEYWTQSLYKKKTKIINPVRQNWAHINFLKNILSDYKYIKYHSIIVFAGRAKLKNVYSKIPVVYKHKLLKTIKQEKTPYLSFEDIDVISNKIREFIVTDKKRKIEHKRYVKRNIKRRKKNLNSLVCPYCGGNLVIRKGKYGRFYGCSNYPKCKFSKKL